MSLDFAATTTCQTPRRTLGWRSFWLLALWLPAAAATAADYQSHQLADGALLIHTDEGQVSLRFHQPGAVEVHYQKTGYRQLDSFSIAAPPPMQDASLSESDAELLYATAQLQARIRKHPLQISYFRNAAAPAGATLVPLLGGSGYESDARSTASEAPAAAADWQLLIAEEAGSYTHATQRGFRFRLSEGEKLLGGGQRVLGMDRRGQRLPLYNKASYGYTSHAKQMYFSVPAVLSSRKYLLLFDNSAKGSLDLGKTEADILEFQAVAGRTSYVVVTGANYPDLIHQYVNVTGKQPLPPRWALGAYASRFGYRTQAEVLATAAKFASEGFPLDAIVLDLYWFGADIKGHMGNLAWDRQAFPEPEKMIAQLAAQGVHTILVTEPFILTTSTRWKEAVDAGVLALDPAGRPKTFDFYFGNTGLVDVFKPAAQTWFWGIYRGLLQQGVAGWWGDLGEPEVHPKDTVHVNGIADEVHNAYGHAWAEMLYRQQVAEQPERRPFIMMRAGAPGSQRYGMIPWTGDVDRSWGGLKPQVELSLQMGLLGFGYTHSDLGGFAGGKRFDRDLYLRWLQYGVFQPVFRPHAQDHIPSEPVFHDKRTRDLARRSATLRYQLLPYLYTLAWQNSTTGMPLMRPLFFLDENDAALMDRKDAYLWGDAFLVAPVTAPKVSQVRLDVPAGVWFDFWNGSRIEGGARRSIRIDEATIPVLVRAGAFVPMIEPIRNSDAYSSARLQLHYYADATVTQSHGQMYDDDGRSRTAIEDGHHELLDFAAAQSADELRIKLARAGGDYAGKPAQRQITLILHQAPTALRSAMVGTQSLAAAASRAAFDQDGGLWRDADSGQLWLRFDWTGAAAEVVLR